MGSKKEKEKKSKSEKIKSETDRKQPSGTGLTSSLTPDCHRKTISPQIKNICSHFSVLQHSRLFFLKLQIQIGLRALINAVLSLLSALCLITM